MKRLFLSSFLILSAISLPAMAQDNMNPDVTPSTTMEQSALMKGVYDRTVNITPQVGVLGFRGGDGNYTSRIIEGFTANTNLENLISMPQSWNLGFETGVLYSHTGSPASNFFGSSAGLQSTPGGNSVLVPIQARLGYKPSDKSLIALNVGSHMIYRSMGNAMQLGRAGDASSSGAFDFLPSIGLSGGMELSRQVALNLKGDWILAPGSDLFTATVGATFGIV